MKDLKEWLNDAVENATKNLAENSACAFFWGEIEMPKCLREEITNENAQKIK
ncbi:MAG: hypothetical protein NC412_14045 [Roseburia sp.]|nr:hypothetical protein [Roseburia sp.]MCM1234223.1 hypothetical protein [Ruminococcus flavefaciens]